MIDPLWIFEGIMAVSAFAIAVQEWQDGEYDLAAGATVVGCFACYIIIYAAIGR